jgi:hypothetical protein
MVDIIPMELPPVARMEFIQPDIMLHLLRSLMRDPLVIELFMIMVAIVAMLIAILFKKIVVG